MRIIKFRGFHADEHGETVIKLDGKEIRGTWFFGDLHTDGPYINEHLVIPDTVGQYTGYYDNVNCRDIFEGDILSYVNGDGDVKYLAVFFGNGCFRYSEEGNYNDNELHSLFCLKPKVCGNIHENPELLEG